MNKQKNYIYKNNIFITKHKGSTHIPVYNTHLSVQQLWIPTRTPSNDREKRAST